MHWRIPVMLAVLVAFAPLSVLASGNDKYEVWAIDQSNSPGKTFGGTLYIWDGHDLERRGRSAQAVAKIDLSGSVATLCMAQTGANPVRPHMMAMNPAQSHAIISFVASGHVLFMDAASRQPVACFRTQPGDAGARQAHMSTPSPDGTYVTVANQNGKLFERILTNYATNTFVHDIPATLNLATCTTPNGLPCQSPVLRPDNAPICPITESTSRFTFVTLRGGGLFVVDTKATPVMRIVGEYDTSVVHGNGCLGAEVPGKMYIDSGGGTAANLHQADLYRFPTDGYSSSNSPNTPAPLLVFSDPSEEADAHGAGLTKHGKYLWIADRGRNFFWVIDTSTDAIVNTIPLAGAVSADPTPDLVVAAPNGSHAFMSLRGPVPLTADPHVSTGSTPGVGVLKITESGRNAVFESVAAVSNRDGTVERADVHALTIRVVK